jgi:hypothetical protein
MRRQPEATRQSEGLQRQGRGYLLCDHALRFSLRRNPADGEGHHAQADHG